MPRSNMPLKPTNAVDIATSTNAPIASDSGTPALLAISIAAPGVDHAVTIGIRQQRQTDAGHAHADAQCPQPRCGFGLRCAQRLRGLEHDHRRTGEPDQHGNEARCDRRRRDVAQPRAVGCGRRSAYSPTGTNSSSAPPSAKR